LENDGRRRSKIGAEWKKFSSSSSMEGGQPKSHRVVKTGLIAGEALKTEKMPEGKSLLEKQLSLNWPNLSQQEEEI